MPTHLRYSVRTLFLLALMPLILSPTLAVAAPEKPAEEPVDPLEVDFALQGEFVGTAFGESGGCQTQKSSQREATLFSASMENPGLLWGDQRKLMS